MSGPMASLPVTIFKFAMSPYENWQKLAWAGVFSAGRSMFVRAVLEDAPCPLLLVPVPAHT